MRRASSTCWPRMRSTARRIFRGVVRTYFSWRATPSCSPHSVAARPARASGTCAWARTRQLVADHGLRDEHRHVLAAVVHRDGVASISGTIVERRDQVFTTRLSPRLFVDDLDHQMVVDERTLLYGPRHWLASTLPAAANDVLVRRLVLPPRAAFLLAPRGRRMPPARGLALAATQRVIDRVHRDAADRRALVLPPGASRLAQLDQLVLGVAHDPDRPRHAGGRAASRRRAGEGWPWCPPSP